MKNINIIKLCFLVLTLITLTSFKTMFDLSSDISKAIEKGNSDELSVFFNNNIELGLLDKNNIYSRQQAKLIIDNFFSENKPEKFEIIYQSKDSDAIQVFGKLTTTAKKTFSVYIYINKINDESVITRFKIEK